MRFSHDQCFLCDTLSPWFLLPPDWERDDPAQSALVRFVYFYSSRLVFPPWLRLCAAASAGPRRSSLSAGSRCGTPAWLPLVPPDTATPWLVPRASPRPADPPGNSDSSGRPEEEGHRRPNHQFQLRCPLAPALQLPGAQEVQLQDEAGRSGPPLLAPLSQDLPPCRTLDLPTRVVDVLNSVLALDWSAELRMAGLDAPLTW